MCLFFINIVFNCVWIFFEIGVEFLGDGEFFLCFIIGLLIFFLELEGFFFDIVFIFLLGWMCKDVCVDNFFEFICFELNEENVSVDFKLKVGFVICVGVVVMVVFFEIFRVYKKFLIFKEFGIKVLSGVLELCCMKIYCVISVLL